MPLPECNDRTPMTREYAYWCKKDNVYVTAAVCKDCGGSVQNGQQKPGRRQS